MMAAFGGPGKLPLNRFTFIFAVLWLSSLNLLADDQILQSAWRSGIGQPPPNPGGRKPSLPTNIDDGFWQGAPVGGFGAGTFSRSYRGNFERWHVKAGVHKYENVPGNQFAVFVEPEGGPSKAIALSTGKPLNGALSSWDWSYPAGAGEYAALYPKSWFAYDRRSWASSSPSSSFRRCFRITTRNPAIRLRSTTGTRRTRRTNVLLFRCFFPGQTWSAGSATHPAASEAQSEIRTK